jgi:alpha-tubulin suppressor-like RCC1 family protein
MLKFVRMKKVKLVSKKRKKATRKKSKSFSNFFSCLKNKFNLFNDNLNKKADTFISIFNDDKPLFKKIEGKKYRYIILPLFFGFKIQFRVIKNPKKIFIPFKNYSQQAVAVVLILVLIIPYFLFNSPGYSSAATYTWVQTDWSDGIDGGTYPNHTDNQTGWTKYSSKDSGITTSSGAVSLAAVSASETQTSDVDFNFGTNNNTNVSGSGSDGLVQMDMIGEDQINTIESGREHSCALTTSGSVYCWGANSNGRIGDGTTIQRNTPVQVVGWGGSGYLTDVVEISAGGYHTCALKSTGSVYCWGANAYGKLGDNTTTQRLTPVRVHGVGDSGYLTGISNISAGDNHTCASASDGTVYCWGQNTNGKLGDGTSSQREVPVQVHGVGDSGMLSGIESVSAGVYNSCAVALDGSAYCWGNNNYGKLGDNTTTHRSTPVQVHGVGDSGMLSNINSISLGLYHTCASASDGTAYCWGSNGWGKLGDGTSSQREVPVQVHGVGDSGYLTGVATVELGFEYSCAVKMDGSAYCWGYNGYNSLGDGTGTSRSTPVQVHGVGDSGYLTGLKYLSAGAAETCAAGTNGEAYCWGQNSYGQLGDNTVTQRSTPVKVHGVGDSGYLDIGTETFLSGDFISSPLNIGGSHSSETLSWSSTLPSENTVVKFRLRSATTLGGLVSATWYGPTGTGDYYTSSGTNLNSVHDGDSFIQYKAYFTRTDSSENPSLNDVTLSYNSFNFSPGVSNITFTTEGNYIQEDSASGTDFSSGTLILSNNGSVDLSDDLTTGGAPTGTPNAFQSGYDIDRTFDDDYDTETRSASVRDHNPIEVEEGDLWSGYDFGVGENHKVISVSIRALNDGGFLFKDFAFEASNDGQSWTSIGTGSIDCSGTWNVDQVFNFDNENSYRTYRIRQTSSGCAGNWYYGMREIFFYENDIDYPTTAKYVTTNDNSQIDVSNWSMINTALVTDSTPASTSIKYLVSFDDRATWKYWNGSFWTASSLGNLQTNGMSSSTLASLTSANWSASGGFVAGTTATLDFAVDLLTSNDDVTPSLDNIAIGYQETLEETLTSSPYDSGSSANVLSSLAWSATVPTSTTVKFQVRSAPDDGGSPGTWTDWCGPDDGDSSTSTCETSTYFTSSDGSQSFDEMFTDGVDDQWVQYKVWLGLESGSTGPTLNDVTMTYVVNSPPNFDATYETNGVGVTFSSSTVTTISYKARDVDTSAGSVENQYKIWPTFEYSTTSGASWITIPTSSLVSGPTSNDDGYFTLVDDSTYVTNSTVWNAKNMVDGIYSTTTQIRVTLNDREAANNTASATSSIFTLDSKDPIVGTPTGGGTGVNINQNATTSQNNQKVATTSVTLYLSSSDDSALEMIISENSDFSGASYEAYSSTKSFILVGNDGTKTVYSKFKDQYGNITSSYNDTITLDRTAPATPSSLRLQDVSNSDNSEYRNFVSWTTSVASDFTSYNIYRSTDGSDFSLLQTVTDISTNYIIDTGLSNGQIYYYKMTVSDDIGNESSYTSTKSQTIGGNPSDEVAPTVSSIATSSIAVTSATVTWTTDEVSDTNVLYSTDDSYGSTQGTSGYTTSHSVKLVGLSAGTTYNFKVRSIDASGNTTLSDAYNFTTSAGDSSGPVISDVSSTEVAATEATITWTTDELASSFVEYSTEDGFSSGTIFGDSNLTTSHSVTLPKVLSSFTNYYFKVRSTDSQGNETVSSQETFQTLTSTDDTTAPVISSVATSSVAYNNFTVTWTTDEDSSSYVEFGKTIYYGRIYGQEESTTTHSVTLPYDLDANTLYYFRVRSKDASGNEGSSERYSITTSASPNDSDSPIISSISVGEPTQTSVTITWTTNEIADSYIGYSQDTSYVLEQGNPTMTTSHSVTLVGLDPSTQYYFRVKSTDPSGNLATDNNSGSGYTFSTASGSAAPVLSNVQITDVDHDSAIVSWITSSNSDSYVDYGFDTSYGLAAGANDSTTAHSVTLSGLLSDATYHFRTRSKASGSEGASDNYTFTTGSAPDVGGPSISSVATSSITTSTAIVTWVTDEDSDSIVDYGTSVSYGSVAANTSDSTTTHAVSLTGLSSGTTYYFKVSSKDSSANITEDDNSSSGYTFTTDADSTAPVISGMSAINVSDTKATIAWDTDELSDSRIDYGTSNSYGNVSTSSTSTYQHSITLTGLSRETTYYFKVTSADSADNSVVSDNSGDGHTFTTTAEPGEVITNTIIVGGGTSIDRTSPVLSDVSIARQTENSFTITWESNENGDSFVEYGKDVSYGTTMGQHDSTSEHTVVLNGLDSDTLYHFRVKTKDRFGNLGSSEDYTGRTLGKGEEPVVIEIPVIEEDDTKPEIVKKEEKKEEELIKEFTAEEKKSLEIIKKGSNIFMKEVFKEWSNKISEELFIASISEMAPKVVASPKISGSDILVEVGSDSAIISWNTDKKSNSIVTYAKAEDYSPNGSNPYTNEESKADELVTSHQIELSRLDSSTTYHFKVKSKALFGKTSESNDFTFTTLSLLPEVNDLRFTDLTETEAKIRWETNIPTKTEVRIKDVSTGEVLTQTDDNYVRDHVFEIKKLISATNYTLSLISSDEEGNESFSTIIPFSTSLSAEAPEISNVRVSTSLVPGKVEKVQTIISWRTNKPATSKIVYSEGLGKELNMETTLDDTLAIDHIVITTAFKTGKVYQFRVESTDSYDNVTYSDNYTILTPKPKESILDLVINNFTDTFGFMKKLRF